jgi:hypothetical protein
MLPALVAAALALVLALAGCAKIDANLSIEGDTVSGTLITALDRDAAEQLELDPEEVFADNDEDLAGVAGVTDAPYQDGSWVGTAYTFDRVSLDELNRLADDNPDGLRITRDVPAGTYTLAMVMDLAWLAELDEDEDLGDELDIEDLNELVDRFEATIVVTFPGEVTEHNGDEISGTTVTWRPEARERTELSAVAQDPDADTAGSQGGEAGRDGDSRPAASAGSDGTNLLAIVLLVGLAVLVLAAAGLGASWLVRHRQPAPASPAGSPSGTSDEEPTLDTEELPPAPSGGSETRP